MILYYTPSIFRQELHLMQASLIQGTGVDVHDVSVVCSPVGQGLVMFHCFLHVLAVVFFNVMMGSERYKRDRSVGIKQRGLFRHIIYCGYQNKSTTRISALAYEKK